MNYTKKDAMDAINSLNRIREKTMRFIDYSEDDFGVNTAQLFEEIIAIDISIDRLNSYIVEMEKNEMTYEDIYNEFKDAYRYLNRVEIDCSRTAYDKIMQTLEDVVKAEKEKENEKDIKR